MSSWTAQTTTDALPEDVIAILTDPGAVRLWSPVDFEVDGLAEPRLAAGSRVRVTGRLAGVDVGFDVEVHHADEERLALAADGPIGLDVLYELAPVEDGSEVRATVGVRRGRGLTGLLLAEATSALLRTGALRQAVDRIAAASARPAAPLRARAVPAFC